MHVDSSRGRPTSAMQPGDGSAVDPLWPPALSSRRHAALDRRVRSPRPRPGLGPVLAVGMAEECYRGADARRRAGCPTFTEGTRTRCSSSLAARLSRPVWPPMDSVCSETKISCRRGCSGRRLHQCSTSFGGDARSRRTLRRLRSTRCSLRRSRHGHRVDSAERRGASPKISAGRRPTTPNTWRWPEFFGAGCSLSTIVFAAARGGSWKS